MSETKGYHRSGRNAEIRVQERGEHSDLKAVALLFAKQRHPCKLRFVNPLRI
jgi:hypothetical protein